jgi:hypothetical protein
VQQFMEVLCLLSRGSCRSPRALGRGPGVIRMFFFVLVGILIPILFLRADLEQTSLSWVYTGEFRDIFVTRYGSWDTAMDFGVARINWDSLGSGRLYYIFICHSWRISMRN